MGSPSKPGAGEKHRFAAQAAETPDTNKRDRVGPESIRRGPWSPEEDRKLMDIIGLHGPLNWVRISLSLKTRSPKQCRERYHQNLKPLLNRSPISQKEGALIEELVSKYGKRWAEIARHLPGRSDNAIKNWWNGGANRRRRASFPHARLMARAHGPPSHVQPAHVPGQGLPSQGLSVQMPQMPQATHMLPVPAPVPAPAPPPALGPVGGDSQRFPLFPPAGHYPLGGEHSVCYLPSLANSPGTPRHFSRDLVYVSGLGHPFAPGAAHGFSHMDQASALHFKAIGSSPKVLPPVGPGLGLGPAPKPSGSPRLASSTGAPVKLPSLPQVAFNTGMFREASPRPFGTYNHNASSESLGPDHPRPGLFDHVPYRKSSAALVSSSVFTLPAHYTGRIPSITSIPSIEANGANAYGACGPGYSFASTGYNSTGNSLGKTSGGSYDYNPNTQAPLLLLLLLLLMWSPPYTLRRPSIPNIHEDATREKDPHAPEKRSDKKVEVVSTFQDTTVHRPERAVVPPFKLLMKSIHLPPLTSARRSGEVTLHP